MLTADLVRPRLSRRKGNLNVQMISLADYHWQQTATELIALFQTHAGSRQENWESALTVYEGNRTDYGSLNAGPSLISPICSIPRAATKYSMKQPANWGYPLVKRSKNISTPTAQPPISW